MLYEASTLAGLAIELVYHCTEQREVVAKWVNTDAKQYCEISSVHADTEEVKNARLILVSDNVIYIDPQRGKPFPHVSKLRHRTVKSWVR